MTVLSAGLLACGMVKDACHGHERLAPAAHTLSLYNIGKPGVSCVHRLAVKPHVSYVRHNMPHVLRASRASCPARCAWSCWYQYMLVLWMCRSLLWLVTEV